MNITLCDNCGVNINEHTLVRARTCFEELKMKRRVAALVAEAESKNEVELKALKTKLTQGKNTK